MFWVLKAAQPETLAAALSQQAKLFCRSASLQEVYYHQAKLPRCMQTTLCSSPIAAGSSPAWLYALACFTEGPDDGSGEARSNAAVQLGQQDAFMLTPSLTGTRLMQPWPQAACAAWRRCTATWRGAN